MRGRPDLKPTWDTFVKARQAAPGLCPREAGVCVRQAMGLEESRREGRRREAKPRGRRLPRREPAQPVHRDAGVRGRAQRTDTGLGATAPTTETGEAGNRLPAIGAAPFSVLASKLADGKDPRANPAGFPTRRTRKPACGGTQKPHGTRLEKCVDALFLNPPVGHVYEGAVAPQ